MDPLTTIVLKLHELEKKLDHMDNVLNNLKKAPSESDNTEHLISEEIHWFFKICRKLCCYIKKKNDLKKLLYHYSTQNNGT